jgi:hypothetical protein
VIAARRRVIALVLAACALAAAGLVAMRQEQVALPTQPPAERPTLLLLTSLPLLLGEDFSLQGNGSAALKGLEAHYRVVPISVTDGSELAKGRLLLMAQPLAQTAENLVTLDAWVRRGGHILLLADPMLEWPSKLPLGDPLRPPPMFADTGLLAHWGLRLDTPERRGPAQRQLAGQRIVTASPGTLWGNCDINADRLAARCTIGKGEAIVIADADLLNVDQLGSGARHNIDSLLRELAMLKHK